MIFIRDLIQLIKLIQCLKSNAFIEYLSRKSTNKYLQLLVKLTARRLRFVGVIIIINRKS